MELLRLTASLALLAGHAGAGTLYVDDSNPNCPGSGTPADPFCTIGDAVAAAAPGDTIFVAPGTYAESVKIGKDGLSLLGAGAASTRIVGPKGAHPLFVDGLSQAVESFTIRGFEITSATPTTFVIGVLVFHTWDAAGTVTIEGCRIERCATGINYQGPSGHIENTVVANCGTGISLYGNAAVRSCTVFDVDGVGIYSPLYSILEVSDTIVASTGWWAIQRYWGSETTIQRVLIHAINLSPPPVPSSPGPFMQYLAEGWPGGFGLWAPFEPLPGPVLEADPLFVAPAAGDVRLQSGSPAIDAGDPAGTLAVPYDVLGFGHPRLMDGDLDLAPRLDLGAVEHGGLLALAAPAVGQNLVLLQSGFPSGSFVLFYGSPGAPLDLGAVGTVFLNPASLVFLAGGALPPSGQVVALDVPVPPSLAGATLAFQGASIDLVASSAARATNLELVTVRP